MTPRPSVQSRLVSWLVNLLILAISLVVMIGGAELAARLLFRDLTTTADTRSYFARRWASSGAIRTNSLGFRERAFAIEKPEGIYRIVVIGDSFTFGQGIRERERFSFVLEDHLGRGRFEVLNFGQSGADTADHIRILEESALKTHPDFVLLQWFINDVEGSDTRGRPGMTLPIPWPDLHERLYRSSALYSLFAMQWFARQTTRVSGGYAEYLRRRFADPNSADSQEATRLLKEFIGRCRARQIPVGVVLFPHLGAEMAASYPFDYLHDRVLETCREEKMTCLDLRAIYGKYDRSRLWANRFDTHPGPLANRLAAAAILNAFAPVWAAHRGS